MGCLTGHHEPVGPQTTEQLEEALSGYFNIPEHLWPGGLQLTKFIQTRLAEEKELNRTVAHKLVKEMGQVITCHRASALCNICHVNRDGSSKCARIALQVL